MAQAVDVAAYRSEFVVANEWAYLDHANLGPLPNRTIDAVKAWADSFAWGSITDTADRARIPGDAAELIAAMANADPTNVAWVSSLAEGMNLLANGLNAKAGDNVVMPMHEFPSVVYPFLNLTRRGVELRWVEKNAAGRTDISLIEAAIDERTRAVVLSHVEYMDGFRNDLSALGAICRDRGIELFVDATQSLGAQPIDLHATGVTALVAHGYKWLMAGFGIGPVIFNRGAVERIDVTYAGRLSVTSSYEETTFELNWRDGAGRYQTGGLNIVGLTALRESARLVTQVGPDWTAQHTAQMLDRLIDGLTTMGYQIVSDLDPAHRSQIMAFTTGDRQRDSDLVDHLRGHNVAVCLRGKGVRVAPYFYNTEEDIDRMLEVLPGS